MEKDYDELWYAYGIQFNAKLEDLNDGDWSKLDEIEQEIAKIVNTDFLIFSLIAVPDSSLIRN